MTFRILSTKAIKQVYNRLLFNQCYICEFQGDGILCQSCAGFLSHNTHHCQRCARPTPIDLEECGDCQRHPPAFDRVIAPLQYEGLCRTMISKAKFEQQPHLLRPLIELLAERLASLPLPSTSWAIVPTSHASLRRRGFCQTQFMRQQLNTLLAADSVIQELRIERCLQSEAQHTLSRQERHKLSAKHFHIPDPAPRHVVLIDDVITTASTIQACSQALKDAGVEHVTVWALARTPEQTGDPF